MENSILEERSFDELIKLYKYFRSKQKEVKGNSQSHSNYQEILDDIDKIILDKYMFEASAEYHHNHYPEN